MERNEKQFYIGQVIKDKRIKKNLTQSQVAKNTGISRNYISDIENGRYMPSITTISKLASYLQIDLNFLLKTTENELKK